jgi:hypothetical protein
MKTEVEVGSRVPIPEEFKYPPPVDESGCEWKYLGMMFGSHRFDVYRGKTRLRATVSLQEKDFNRHFQLKEV